MQNIKVVYKINTGTVNTVHHINTDIFKYNNYNAWNIFSFLTVYYRLRNTFFTGKLWNSRDTLGCTCKGLTYNLNFCVALPKILWILSLKSCVKLTIGKLIKPCLWKDSTKWSPT